MTKGNSRGVKNHAFSAAQHRGCCISRLYQAIKVPSNTLSIIFDLYIKNYGRYKEKTLTQERGT